MTKNRWSKTCQRDENKTKRRNEAETGTFFFSFFSFRALNSNEKETSLTAFFNDFGWCIRDFEVSCDRNQKWYLETKPKQFFVWSLFWTLSVLSCNPIENESRTFGKRRKEEERKHRQKRRTLIGIARQTVSRRNRPDHLVKSLFDQREDRKHFSGRWPNSLIHRWWSLEKFFFRVGCWLRPHLSHQRLHLFDLLGRFTDLRVHNTCHSL